MKSIFDRMAMEDDNSSQETGPVAGPSTNGRPDADSGDGAFRASAEVKKLTQELLKHGYLEEAQGSDLFHRAMVHERAIMAALEPLDLVLRLDSHRGVAYLAVSQAAYQESNVEEGWAHPLVRRQRLTLEQSLLVALLRQAFVMHEQEAGIGQSAATIAVEDLLPQFLVYFGDTGSDAKNESRLLNLLEQLKTYGIVSEVDSKHELIIRPLIAHMANPESLAALLTVLKELRNRAVAPRDEEPC
jgi:hypothetical protein